MYFSYSYILAVLTVGPEVARASKSQDFLANPEKYFRDPCPDERPDNRCTVRDPQTAHSNLTRVYIILPCPGPGSGSGRLIPVYSFGRICMER